MAPVSGREGNVMRIVEQPWRRRMDETLKGLPDAEAEMMAKYNVERSPV